AALAVRLSLTREDDQCDDEGKDDSADRLAELLHGLRRLLPEYPLAQRPPDRAAEDVADQEPAGDEEAVVDELGDRLLGFVQEPEHRRDHRSASFARSGDVEPERHVAEPLLDLLDLRTGREARRSS